MNGIADQIASADDANMALEVIAQELARHEIDGDPVEVEEAAEIGLGILRFREAKHGQT